jgi:acyl-CoA reductase-like NAD-dependent aldehyde dehydrogenase
MSAIVKHAKLAQQLWAALSLEARGEKVSHAYQLLSKVQDHLALLISKETGNDSLIVMVGANIDKAVQFVVASSFENTGQMRALDFINMKKVAISSLTQMVLGLTVVLLMINCHQCLS